MEKPMTMALPETFPAALLPPAGYVRRSSPLQATNFSLEAQNPRDAQRDNPSQLAAKREKRLLMRRK